MDLYWERKLGPQWNEYWLKDLQRGTYEWHIIKIHNMDLDTKHNEVDLRCRTWQLFQTRSNSATRRRHPDSFGTVKEMVRGRHNRHGAETVRGRHNPHGAGTLRNDPNARNETQRNSLDKRYFHRGIASTRKHQHQGTGISRERTSFPHPSYFWYVFQTQFANLVLAFWIFIPPKTKDLMLAIERRHTTPNCVFGNI